MNHSTSGVSKIIVGLPGLADGQSKHGGHQVFFYLLMCIGQLQERLIRPYLMLPLSMGALVDTSRLPEERISLAQSMLQKRDCCVEKHFAAPVLMEMQQSGGAASVLPGSVLFDDLSTCLRTKTYNLEIELNFARASNMRKAMRGRKHNIASMCSKHIGAEVKLAQRRRQLACNKENHISTEKPTGALVEL